MQPAEAPRSDPMGSWRPFERFVALGDSSAEGLDDPDGEGGYRGWADRLATRLAEAQGSVLYANLAVRGRKTRQVLEDQLPRALAMQPDLAAVITGTNDFVRRAFDLDVVAADLERLLRGLRSGGATVLTFTMPDLTPVMPLARRLTPRVEALNRELRRIADRTGSLLVDVAAHPVASDPRLWSGDRIHANSAGHERIAAALAQALGLPGADSQWAEPLAPLPPRSPARLLVSEAAWIRRHLLPWIWRHLRGRSSGDGRAPKRPELTKLRGAGDP